VAGSLVTRGGAVVAERVRERLSAGGSP